MGGVRGGESESVYLRAPVPMPIGHTQVLQVLLGKVFPCSQWRPLQEQLSVLGGQVQGVGQQVGGAVRVGQVQSTGGQGEGGTLGNPQTTVLHQRRKDPVRQLHGDLQCAVTRGLAITHYKPTDSQLSYINTAYR